MAIIRGREHRVHFMAWNSDGTPRTGDASNIVVRLKRDSGSLSVAANAPTEVSSSQAPGLYEILLTATEMNATSVLVVPQSTTTGVRCQSFTIITTDIVSSDSSPLVVDSNNRARSLVHAYATGLSPGAQVLYNPNYKLATDESGGVFISTPVMVDMSQSVPSNPGANTTGDALRRAIANLDALISSRLASSAYTPPDNSSIASVKTKTDQMSFTSGNIHARTVVNADKTGYELTSTERGNIASSVWSAGSRTLTSFGTLVTDIAAAVFSYTIESGHNFLQWMRYAGAVLFGKAVRSGTTYIYHAPNDTTGRITGTVDDNGNRTIINRNG